MFAEEHGLKFMETNVVTLRRECRESIFDFN